MTAKMGLSWVIHSIYAYGFKISEMHVTIHDFFHSGYNRPTFQSLQGLLIKFDSNLLWLRWLLNEETSIVLLTTVDDLHRKCWPNLPQTNKTATPKAKAMFPVCKRMCLSGVPIVRNIGFDKIRLIRPTNFCRLFGANKSRDSDGCGIWIGPILTGRRPSRFAHFAAFLLTVSIHFSSPSVATICELDWQQTSCLKMM